jgi:uncharacterized membrane protein YjfL (UPF0719 family)
MDLIQNIAHAVVYLGVGFVLLALGVFVNDLVTPGPLLKNVIRDAHIPSTIFAVGGLVGMTLIVFTSMWTNASGTLGEAIGWTVVFALLGIVMQVLAFKVLDWVTPGDLGAIVCDVVDGHRGRYVTAVIPAVFAAAAQVAVSVIVVAAIA